MPPKSCRVRPKCWLTEQRCRSSGFRSERRVLARSLAKCSAQKCPCKLRKASMKFARRAARLIQHRGIEKQRDARDEWRLLLPRFGRFAAPGRRLASLAEFRVQREVTAELPAIFGAPVLRARQRRCQFAKKKVDRLFFLRSEFAQLLFAEKSGQCGTGFNNQ